MTGYLIVAVFFGLLLLAARRVRLRRARALEPAPTVPDTYTTAWTRDPFTGDRHRMEF